MEIKQYEKQTCSKEKLAADKSVQSYKGITVGQIVFRECMFSHNEFREEVVLGFSHLLLKGNQFADPETRKNGIRRVIVASTYKKKLEGPHSQPLPEFTTEPTFQKVPKCKYCHRRPVDKANCGACNSPRCIIQAMRDNL